MSAYFGLVTVHTALATLYEYAKAHPAVSWSQCKATIFNYGQPVFADELEILRDIIGMDCAAYHSDYATRGIRPSLSFHAWTGIAGLSAVEGGYSSLVVDLVAPTDKLAQYQQLFEAGKQIIAACQADAQQNSIDIDAPLIGKANWHPEVIEPSALPTLFVQALEYFYAKHLERLMDGQSSILCNQTGWQGLKEISDRLALGLAAPWRDQIPTIAQALATEKITKVQTEWAEFTAAQTEEG